MHERYHYGRDRLLDKLNAKFCIPNGKAREIIARVSDQCPACLSKQQLPANPPTTPIISMDFGERILVDLKKLHTSFIIVAVDHWSNYAWLGYLDNKEAEGVAQFLDSVFEDIANIRASWKLAREEAASNRKGGLSFPVNTTGEGEEWKELSLYLFEDHSNMLEVRPLALRNSCTAQHSL